MNQKLPVKIQAETAAQVCANFDLDSRARKLLRDEMSPQEFVKELIDKKQFVPAIEFLAHALPVREGVWWGALCMHHVMGEDLSLADQAAASAAVMWVMQPDERTCAAAKAPGESADPLSAAGALALAASQTADPWPFAHAESVANAVKLASLKMSGVNMQKIQRAFVDLGLQVAEGGLL
ncbi:MAG: hypothetical protein ABSF22_06345 [Bryobacteraceae bacterium]